MNTSNPRTEQQLADAKGIDTWEDARILKLLVTGQQRAIKSVEDTGPAISRAATALAERLSSGGKLYYAGAGSSIRIGVQDGSELHATFGMPEDNVGYLIAGGRPALTETLAAAEDDVEAGARDAAICQPGDAVLAIAASGTTPYTIAVAQMARSRGSLVIAVVNNAGRPLGEAADIEIVLDSGPEVISGSTRLGAGTAQKAALNLLSTLTYIKLGAIHDGLMVNVQADNAKLRQRARGIINRITGADDSKAGEALKQSNGNVKIAVLLCAGAANADAAQKLLGDSNGNLRIALSNASRRY